MRRPSLCALSAALTLMFALPSASPMAAAQQQPSQPTPALTPKPAPGPDSLSAAAARSRSESGFASLFDGKTLDGWTLMGKHGDGYGVKDGMIYCAHGGGGNLFTEREYSNFVLRFEFRMPTEGANNGVGIRAPLEGDAAYVGMEIQILDEATALSGKWGKLRDAQYQGSIYDVVPAKRGAMKPVGDWNREEIIANGRHITVTLNDQVILDANLDDVTDPAVLAKHPGLQRKSGHIGFLGHNDYIEFRNIRVKEL
jgi:Domain of Unknown Function (DUF1080)